MDFTFLTEDQVWGDGALDVMKRYGTKVAPTDLAVILGGYADWNRENYLTCNSWTASSRGKGYVYSAYISGASGSSEPDKRTVSARPALPPSEASKISPSKARTINGIRVAEYGEYPQTVADDETSEKLERLHASRCLRPTGKKLHI